ncbi:MAG TPA: hypothetical protein DCZ01_05245 [Elusimicrobia bacterium]|nr:MAG: hypothetical protein A2X37_08390 [Elusimicrobia bacterium GWA2_66_18]OGR74572.1 MAG: hypothetical protein A2X40_09085 [Elusimicrobia bacterium GWC2_65_9]HAZ07928.1 hypothetical protein [Elusimicrobiota bacterium]
MLNFTPRSIEKVEDAELRIVWDDGHETALDFSLLRRQCPCAVCKDEWTGEALLDPASVPETVAATRADTVGNYALSFTFSDGHGTGIYTFEMLRKLCRCPECSYHTGSETN